MHSIYWTPFASGIKISKEKMNAIAQYGAKLKINHLDLLSAIPHATGWRTIVENNVMQSKNPSMHDKNIDK